MKINSIHIGKSAVFKGNGEEHESAINKKPTPSARVKNLGLVGDVQFNKEHHGGPDQAVYAYAQSDYNWWKSERNLDVFPGSFGENLVVDSFDAQSIYVGDRFHFADVILEVSAPRIPCHTFSAYFNRPSLIREFVEAKRPGIYFRVIKEGEVSTGELIELERGSTDISIVDFFDYYYAEKTPLSLRRYLDAPIDIRSRKTYEAMLTELEQKENP